MPRSAATCQAVRGATRTCARWCRPLPARTGTAEQTWSKHGRRSLVQSATQSVMARASVAPSRARSRRPGCAEDRGGIPSWTGHVLVRSYPPAAASAPWASGARFGNNSISVAPEGTAETISDQRSMTLTSIRSSSAERNELDQVIAGLRRDKEAAIASSLERPRAARSSAAR